MCTPPPVPCAFAHARRRPHARARRARMFRPRLQPLEARALLAATPLYWGSAASLPAATGAPGATVSNAAIIVAADHVE